MSLRALGRPGRRAHLGVFGARTAEAAAGLGRDVVSGGFQSELVRTQDPLGVPSMSRIEQTQASVPPRPADAEQTTAGSLRDRAEVESNGSNGARGTRRHAVGGERG
jgi:hypothetical protein